MKYFIFILSGIALLLFACDFPSILSEDTRSESNRREVGVVDTLLTVEITVGFAGVHQQLVVDQSGLAIFIDGFRANSQWTVQLTLSEVQALTALLLDNNFFGLRGPYIDPQVADAFYYKITFIHSRQRNTVITDRFGAPETLKRIVDGIVALQKRIIENGLSLKLEVKPLASDHGQFDLTLTVANVSSETIDLRFSTSQVFDFYARKSGLEMSPGRSNGGFWNWAHNKVFTQSLATISLPAGESLSYRVTWDGRDNAGDLLSGEVFIGAFLKSLPGGSAEEQVVKL